MTTPPRFTETVLSTLGASPEYRDAVVGDMAEEFAWRVRWDGEAAALAWYHREALRSIPHLLANGLRDVRPSDISRTAGMVVTAWLLTGASVGVGLTILNAVLRLLLPMPAWLVPFGPVSMALILSVLALGGFSGGYIAAWLDRRTPLITATALGVTWGLTELALYTIGLVGPAPLWFPVVAPLVIAGSAIAGGLRQLRSRWAGSGASIEPATEN